MKQKLDRFFKITERGSSVKTEIIGGLTTFFAMAYIVVTNPNQITGFSTNGDLGTIWNAVYIASILVSVIGTLLYAFYAKLPYVQACGMGLNSFFFVSFILPALAGNNAIEGYKEGLCTILMSGVLFLILSITGAREYIAKSLPNCLKTSISAGIGLFIAFVGLKNVGIIQTNMYTFVQFFDFHGIIDAVGKSMVELGAGNAVGSVSDAVYGSYQSYFNYDMTAIITGLDAWRVIAPIVLAILGLVLITVFENKRVKGGVMIVIVIITGLYYLVTWQIPSFNLGQVGQAFTDFAEIGLFGAFDGFGVFTNGIESLVNAVILVLTFFLVDMFDTIGTLYATGAQTGMMDENGDPIDMDKSMTCDSAATLAGSLLGTSTCTTVVESSAGIAAGARTGLASIVTAACMFICLFLTPVAAIVPACATAPALVYVGALMLKNFAKIDMNDICDAVPAFLALIMMPLTYSISNGIAIGAIAYTVITLLRGKFTKKDIVVAIIALLFTVRFFFISM